jgi:lipopolysaccharide export system permease protein
MSVAELQRFIRGSQKKDARYYAALIELHERFSIPFACFALGLLAVPLGLQPMAGRRAFGLVLGLLFFTLYYLMLIVGWSFGESGVYPPALGMWMPNLVLGGVGLILLVKTARERPVRIDSLIIAIQRMVRRAARRGAA